MWHWFSLGPQAYCICPLYTCTIFKQGKWMAALKNFARDDLLERRSRANFCFTAHCATDDYSLLRRNDQAQTSSVYFTE